MGEPRSRPTGVPAPEAGLQLRGGASVLGRRDPSVTAAAPASDRAVGGRGRQSAGDLRPFGLGKTRMALETVWLTLAAGRPAWADRAPLGVRQEFRHDAAKIGVEVTFVRRTEEILTAGSDRGRIYLTNYESVRDGRPDPDLFDVVVVRRGGGAALVRFQDLHRVPGDVRPLRAPVRRHGDAVTEPVQGADPTTPRSWDHGHRSALTRFFQRDSTQANNLTLYPHKEREFPPVAGVVGGVRPDAFGPSGSRTTAT